MKKDEKLLIELSKNYLSLSWPKRTQLLVSLELNFVRVELVKQRKFKCEND